MSNRYAVGNTAEDSNEKATRILDWKASLLRFSGSNNTEHQQQLL